MRAADDIFHDAREIKDPAQRAAYLDTACAGDAELRAKVDELLRADAELGGFLASRASGQTTLEPVPLSERAGSRIGPYKLLQPIGEGGFGTVFLAEQSEPVRRKVALKIIKLGMDSRQVVARFEAERQALAVMNHPHIARVFDGGMTDSGRPYFVMEYVVGDAITPFCDAHKLSVHERLDLFQQVCAAVQHAHTKGIIHRDLKPANVLVSMVDGKPFAKVIDFGIAKATASPLTDKTLFTEHRQLIGTPEYMSPEQAEGSPDIDTRTDVYALGVLLYELLTGLTPFDAKRLRSAAYAEMQRIIREEDPPAPSLRLARSLGTLATAAATRGVEPGKLSTLVKGELDWIVMKALDKDRARRYETAVALAADVQRHLSGEAVVAAPPSAAYRVKKFVRRNKGPVIAGSAVAASLLVGLAGTALGWREAIHSRAENANHARNLQEALSMIAEEAESNASEGGPGILDQINPEHLFPGITLHEDGGFSGGPSGDMISELRDTTIWYLQHATRVRQDLRVQTDAAEWSAYTANLALAQQAMEAGNYPEARERLAECPEGKRGWEWEFLLRSAQSVSWEARGNAGNVAYRPTVSHDGTVVAIPHYRGQMWLDASTGEPIQPWSDASTGSYFAAFSPTDRQFATSQSVGGSALIVEDSGQVHALPESDDEYSANWSADGRRIAFTARSTTAVWDVAKQVVIGVFPSSSTEWPVPTAINGDGSLLAVPVAGGVEIWDIESRSVVSEIHSETAHVRSISFSPVANKLLILGTALQVVDARTGDIEHRFPLRGHDAIWFPSGDKCVVANHHWLSVVDFTSGMAMPLWTSDSLQEGIEAAIHVDGNSLVVRASGPDSVPMIRVLPLDQHGSPAYILEQYVWTGTYDSDVPPSVKPMVSLAVDKILGTERRTSDLVVLSTLDNTRIIRADGRSLRFFDSSEPDPAKQRELAVFRMDADITNLQMTGDGTRLIIHLGDGSARVWDIRDPEERRKDLQAEWAERVPAGAYLDTLWNSDTPTDKLLDAIADQSLTPLRRLVAAEMLDERQQDARWEAKRLFTALTEGQTDKAAVLASARAAEVHPASGSGWWRGRRRGNIGRRR